MPEKEDRFLDPQSESDQGEVRRLVRSAIEKEPNFHTRMKAVSDLLALMTPENALDMRDAFVNSRKDGFWYGIERKVFMARYGEVMGKQAADEFKDDPDLVRILESWALVDAPEAVDWINEMPPGQQQRDAVNRLIGAFGATDLDYAVEVFQALPEEDQPFHQRALTEAAIRSGGREAGTRLAFDLLAREETGMQRAGQKTLQSVFEFYKDPAEQEAWLRKLSPEMLALINPATLPEDFRPSALPE